jgi:hypothetical protein
MMTDEPVFEIKAKWQKIPPFPRRRECSACGKQAIRIPDPQFVSPGMTVVSFLVKQDFVRYPHLYQRLKL